MAAVGHRFHGWGRLFGGKPTQLGLAKWHNYRAYTVFTSMAHTWHTCLSVHYRVNQLLENTYKAPTPYLKNKRSFKFEIDV